MKIEFVKLSMKNFVSHKETKDLEFPIGITAIIGDNGAGKSSIIQAIKYALFGDRVRGAEIKNIIRNGIEKSEKLEIELHVKIDNVEYIINRTRTLNDNTLDSIKNLDKNELKGRGGITKINDIILDLLNMDKDILTNSLFVDQGQIAKLIDEKPAERMNFMGKLIGLDKLEKSWELMKNVIEYFSNLLDKKAVIKSNLERLNKDKIEIENDIKETETVIKESKDKLTIYNKKIAITENELKNLETKRNQYNSLNVEIGKLETEIKLTIDKIEELNKQKNNALMARQNMEPLKKDINRIKPLKMYIDLVNKREKLIYEKNVLESELNRLKDYQKRIDQNKDYYQKYLDIKQELASKKLEREQKQDAKANYDKIENEINLKDGQVKKIEKELEKIADACSNYFTEICIDAKKSFLEKLETEIKDIDIKISELEKSIGGYKSKLKEIDEYLNILGDNNQCPVCLTRLTEEHRNKIVTHFEDEKNNIMQKLDSIKNEIKEYKLKKKEIEKERINVNKLDVERYELYSQELHELNKNLEELLKLKSSLQEEAKDLDVIKKNIKELEEKMSSLEPYYHEYNSAKNELEKGRNIEVVEKENTELDSKITEIDQDIDKVKTKLEPIPEDPAKELEDLQKKKEKYEVLKAEADKLDEITSKLEEHIRTKDNLSSKLKDLKDELIKLDYSDEKYNMKKQEYDELNAIIASINAKIKEKEIQLQKLNRKFDEIKKEVKDLETLMQQFKKIEDFIDKLTTIRNGFHRNNIQKLIRVKVASSLTKYSKEFLEKFGLSITDIEINENLDIKVIGT
ncbi:MAG: AAA family ATPase, partial [Candidatus Helarchaeota archaeon]